jgi:hypothetical protein
MAPLIIRPRTANFLSRLRMTPSRLRMNPSGVAVNKVSPPRAVRGDPQPGLHSHKTANVPRAASEQHRPIRPRPVFGFASGSAWITGGCSIFRPLELDVDGLAGRWQRLEIELDVDGNFLADQVLGYSP